MASEVFEKFGRQVTKLLPFLKIVIRTFANLHLDVHVRKVNCRLCRHVSVKQDDVQKGLMTVWDRFQFNRIEAVGTVCSANFSLLLY